MQWKQYLLYVEIAMVTVATTLGTGILALPVRLASSGIGPFLFVLTAVLLMQLAVSTLVTELLQRAEKQLGSAESQKESSALSPMMENSDGESSTDTNASTKKQEVSLETLARLYLSPHLHRLFSVLAVAHFLSILVSYALAGSGSIAVLIGAENKGELILIPFVIIISTLVVVAGHRLQPLVAALTVVKTVLLLVLIIAVAAAASELRSQRIADGLETVDPRDNWSSLLEPFLICTVALGGSVNLQPVLYARLPAKKTPNVMRGYLFSICAGLILCWAINISWAIHVLNIVPQTDEMAERLGISTSLETANRLGQISTIPLSEILGSLKLGFVSLGDFVTIFIALSVAISFTVMSLGIVHLLKGISHSLAGVAASWTQSYTASQSAANAAQAREWELSLDPVFSDAEDEEEIGLTSGRDWTESGIGAGFGVDQGHKAKHAPRSKERYHDSSATAAKDIPPGTFVVTIDSDGDEEAETDAPSRRSASAAANPNAKSARSSRRTAPLLTSQPPPRGVLAPPPHAPGASDTYRVRREVRATNPLRLLPGIGCDSTLPPKLIVRTFLPAPETGTAATAAAGTTTANAPLGYGYYRLVPSMDSTQAGYSSPSLTAFQVPPSGTYPPGMQHTPPQLQQNATWYVLPPPTHSDANIDRLDADSTLAVGPLDVLAARHLYLHTIITQYFYAFFVFLSQIPRLLGLILFQFVFFPLYRLKPALIEAPFIAKICLLGTFTLVLAISLGDPTAAVSSLEVFTSFALNFSCGILLAIMFQHSREYFTHHTFAAAEHDNDAAEAYNTRGIPATASAPATRSSLHSARGGYHDHPGTPMAASTPGGAGTEGTADLDEDLNAQMAVLDAEIGAASASSAVAETPSLSAAPSPSLHPSPPAFTSPRSSPPSGGADAPGLSSVPFYLSPRAALISKWFVQITFGLAVVVDVVEVALHVLGLTTAIYLATWISSLFALHKARKKRNELIFNTMLHTYTVFPPGSGQSFLADETQDGSQTDAATSSGSLSLRQRFRRRKIDYDYSSSYFLVPAGLPGLAVHVIASLAASLLLCAALLSTWQVDKGERANVSVAALVGTVGVIYEVSSYVLRYIGRAYESQYFASSGRNASAVNAGTSVGDSASSGYSLSAMDGNAEDTSTTRIREMKETFLPMPRQKRSLLIALYVLCLVLLSLSFLFLLIVIGIRLGKNDFFLAIVGFVLFITLLFFQISILSAWQLYAKPLLRRITSSGLSH